LLGRNATENLACLTDWPALNPARYLGQLAHAVRDALRFFVTEEFGLIDPQNLRQVEHNKTANQRSLLSRNYVFGFHSPFQVSSKSSINASTQGQSTSA